MDLVHYAWGKKDWLDLGQSLGVGRTDIRSLTVVGSQNSAPLSGGQEGQTVSPGTGFSLGDTGGPSGITYVARNCSDLAQALIFPSIFRCHISWFLSLRKLHVSSYFSIIVLST